MGRNCSHGGFGPDVPQPPARGESLKKFVSGMKEVDNNLPVLEGRQIAAAHLLSRANDTLQCAPAPDRDLSTKTETTETETHQFSLILCPLWTLFLHYRIVYPSDLWLASANIASSNRWLATKILLGEPLIQIAPATSNYTSIIITVAVTWNLLCGQASAATTKRPFPSQEKLYQHEQEGRGYQQIGPPANNQNVPSHHHFHCICGPRVVTACTYIKQNTVIHCHWYHLFRKDYPGKALLHML